MEKLITILNDLLNSIGGKPIEKLEPSLNLKQDLEIDSISYAVLLVNIENEFGIKISSEGRAETLGDLMERLEI